MNALQAQQTMMADAGLLREHIATRFADSFLGGFTYRNFSDALRLCERLACLSGQDRDRLFESFAASAEDDILFTTETAR